MAVNNNTTTTSNNSWLDKFTGFLGNAGNIFMSYQDQKNKAELDKIQAQNSLANGKQQLAIYEQQQIRANMLLWGAFAVAVIVVVMIIKRVTR